MAENPVFVTNTKGATHNVPGEWVVIDAVGDVTVRGNRGFRLATEDEIDKWHDDQGLDNDVREGFDEADDVAIPQISNMTVEQPGQAPMQPPTPGDALAEGPSKSSTNKK